MRISNSFYIIILTLCFFLSFVAKAKENSYLWNKLVNLAPENAEKLKAIGGELGLKNFLAKYKDAPCGNCKEAGRKIFGGRTLDEMLENYVEAAHTFRNRPDLWKKIEEGALVAMPLCVKVLSICYAPLRKTLRNIRLKTLSI